MEDKWYAIDKSFVINDLKSDYNGLSTIEAKERITKYGKNELPKKKSDGFFKLLIKGLFDPIIIVLIITIVFSFVINEKIDAYAILFIMLVDLVIGAIQELSASKTADSLAKLIKVNTKVLRDGKEISISSSDITIGDIILLESGDKISCDARIIESTNLQVDESTLTGESTSVSKFDTVLDEDKLLSECSNMVFAGTTVLTGRARCIVTDIGIKTEVGKIAHKVTTAKDEKSPLTIRMEKFSKQICLMILIVALIITIVLFSKGLPGKEIFLAVIALSVSAMPEGLPLALTLALTISSKRMLKKNVIVKKLTAAESLGSCTLIASDKTGTLTVNEQTAKKIVLPNNDSFDVTGTGYNIDGIISATSSDEMRAKNIAFLGVINNEATFEDEENMHGDSIDIAFLVLGKKANVSNMGMEILAKIPYESEKGYSAVFYKDDNKIYCTVKGSLEKVLSFCKYYKMNDKIKKINEKKLREQNDILASNGYRVIALASTIVKKFEEKESYCEKDIPPLCFEGMVGFIDPIREDVKESIELCQKASVKVVMITGDHPLTAYNIAKELNIATLYDEVTTGNELDSYYEKGIEIFDEFIKTKKVFSRITPIQKLEIVESYKRLGEFVAVTGDGVNDTPALKSANIGVAMGSGTSAALETASMIIADDNFKSIVSSIKEGRGTYSNIRKVSYLLLSCGFAEVLFFLLSVIFNFPMPLVAIQLLWLNITTDGLQDLALSFEKTDDDIMLQKPKNTNESVFNKELLTEVLISGLSMGLIVFLAWVILLDKLKFNVYVARGYIMMLMVFMQNMHTLNCRSESKHIYEVGFKKNPFVIFSIILATTLQIIVAEVPILSEFLDTTSVPVLHMIILFLISCNIIIIVELYKSIKKRKERKYEFNCKKCE